MIVRLAITAAILAYLATRIDMAAAVDSLNVATALAIALQAHFSAHPSR